MTPAVGSSTSTFGKRTVDSDTTLAELNRQVQSLRQKLAQVGKDAPPPPPPSDSQSVTLSREMVSVQAQIERVILEAQLTKLGAISSTANKVQGEPSPAATPASDGARASSDARHSGASPGGNSAHAHAGHGKGPGLAVAAAQYQPVKPLLSRLDETA